MTLLSFGTIATTLQVGIQYAVARKAALGCESSSALVRQGFWAALPWGTLAIVFLVLSGPISHYLQLSGPLPVVYAVGYASALVAFGIPCGVLIGRQRLGRFAALAGAAVILRLAYATLLGWRSGQGALLATFLSTASATALAVVALPRREPRAGSSPGGSRRDALPEHGRISLAGDSTYGGLVAAILWVTWTLPLVFARHFLPSSIASDFAAAQLIVSGLLFLASSFMVSFYPLIARGRRRRDIGCGLGATAVLCLFGTAGATVIGPRFIEVAYGRTFSVSAGVFLALGASVTAIALGSYCLWVAHALQAARGAVAFGAVVSVVVELVVGGLIAHGTPLALAGGPVVATAAGTVMACLAASRARRGRSAQRSRRELPDTEPRISPLEPSLLWADGTARPLARTAVGMMVHNEVHTIRRCLEAVLNERDGDARVPTVLVVVSGSTDGTDEVVRQVAATDSRVRMLHEPQRSGKASAINWFLAETEEPLVGLVGGDTLLAPGSLTKLLAPLADCSVGMTGARVMPTNPRVGLVNRLVHLVWELHHEVARRQPKLGEAVAFRRVFHRIDTGSLADETSIEATVTHAGYELRYVPDAVVFNNGPTTLADYAMQRERIHRGHLGVKSTTGYAPATLSGRNLVAATCSATRRHPASTPVVAIAIAIEARARHRAGRSVAQIAPGPVGIWEPIESAKHAFDVPEAWLGSAST